MNELSVSTYSSNAISKNLSEAGSTADTQIENESFKQLLSYMMLSSMGSTSGETGGITSLLSPLMLLLEQVQAQQLSAQMDTSATTGSNSTSAANAAAAQNDKFPVNGFLTQNFHSGHIGLDFGVVVGTPVQSTIEGKVTYAGWNNEGYGNLVIVDNGSCKTYYAHLSEIPVTAGQTVQKGDVIGLSGNTGNSTGPHLHYEVRMNGQPIDPASFDPDTL